MVIIASAMCNNVLVDRRMELHTLFTCVCVYTLVFFNYELVVVLLPMVVGV